MTSILDLVFCAIASVTYAKLLYDAMSDPSLQDQLSAITVSDSAKPSSTVSLRGIIPHIEEKLIRFA